MPQSQLKRLRSSLREQGIIGAPPKSKKQKKRQHEISQDQRAQRAAQLEKLREDFNPFEYQGAGRPRKFEATTGKVGRGKIDKDGKIARPGLSRSLGEEARRKTLLVEMQKRNKVGGISDRRFGENDPGMTPEERMAERFVREKVRNRGGGLFDLEDGDEGEEAQLMHLGRPLGLHGDLPLKDDFDEKVPGSGEESEGEGRRMIERRLKRGRSPGAADEDEGDESVGDEPAKKKSKAEVMKEVIAKSKLHKYERQQAREDDEELREELDKDLPSILAALRSTKPPPVSVPQSVQPGDPRIDSFSMNPERAVLMNGAKLTSADRDYDLRMREMAMDKRSQPTERTKTQEERAREEAQRLKELEEKRQRRMRGEEADSDEENDAEPRNPDVSGDQDMADDAAGFGITNAVHTNRGEGTEAEDQLRDEDLFEIDEDLVANGSDVSEMESLSPIEDSEDEGNAQDDEEEEFIGGLLSKEERGRPVFKPSATAGDESSRSNELAYTYPCPKDHDELVQIMKDVPINNVPTVVQRIRALYHPQLLAENNKKMADFSVALVDYVASLTSHKPPLTVLESLIRHLHSLSRSFPEPIATAFRRHLRAMHTRGNLTSGDMTILTAISAIYPTSDHFHPVATPAMAIVARWLGLTTPVTEKEETMGAYLVALCAKYQRLSKRYVPETIRFTLAALRSRPESGLLQTHVGNIVTLADLWRDQPAFTEIFTPVLRRLQSAPETDQKALQRLAVFISLARFRRRPLLLHNHRPLPIKSSIPKFEENFNPDRHYDPDKDRSEAAKLRKEYKREKKGAMRELRKDASFVARERLREKKEKDRAYEEKYRKLVASVQAEEGREANEYEREKRRRKAGR